MRRWSDVRCWTRCGTRAHAICRRLGVTVEYVLDGTEQGGADEAEAVALLRHADPALRDAAMNALRGMLSGKAQAVAGRH